MQGKVPRKMLASTFPRAEASLPRLLVDIPSTFCRHKKVATGSLQRATLRYAVLQMEQSRIYPLFSLALKDALLGICILVISETSCKVIYCYILKVLHTEDCCFQYDSLL